jgi:hypothetical protein
MADIPLDPSDDELTAARLGFRGERDRALWFRRAVVVALLAYVVLALSDFFGQKQTTSGTSAPAASIRITMPPRARSGLLYQARFVIRANRKIDELRLILGPGWFDGLTINNITPQPNAQTSHNGETLFGWNVLEPGKRYIVWIEYQANGTTTGKRSLNGEVDDGTTTLVRFHRAFTIFP